jgi:hypothetical protein
MCYLDYERSNIKTDCCYAKDQYKNIKIADILFGETPKDCEKIMERKQNLEKMHALFGKPGHLGEILCRLSTLVTKHYKDEKLINLL